MVQGYGLECVNFNERPFMYILARIVNYNLYKNKWVFEVYNTKKFTFWDGSISELNLSLSCVLYA